MATFYRNCGSFANLFSEGDERIAASLIETSDDPLWKIEELVDFEALRPVIEEKLRAFKPLCLGYKSAGTLLSRNGRPALDPLLMFKIVFIQMQFNLSDHAVVVQIKDRVSFRRFLNISYDLVPGASTVWKYRELFTKCGLQEQLSKLLIQRLEMTPAISEGEARIIDSSFTEVRVQRNTAEENKIIKSGEGETLWQDQPTKKRQKDIDARWTKKGNKSFFGYKIHTKVCALTKLIVQIHTTPAHVHDSQVIAPLLNDKDKEKQVYADAGYAGAAQEALVRGFGAIPVFCEKAYRNVPLTDGQKANNHVKSSVRSRIEHVFGFVENTLHGARSRYVGLARNNARHWMLVFCYNLNRLVQLKECGFRKTLGPPTAPV